MFRRVAATASVVACNTCRYRPDRREDEAGVRGGARLTAALQRLADANHRFRAIHVQDMPCLFACSSSCAVYLRAPAKIGYVLGNLDPDGEAAAAILEFACLYADSEHGQVPYRQWPDGVKGHFLVRVPPEGQVLA